MYDVCMYLGMYMRVRMRPKELILDPLLPLSPSPSLAGSLLRVIESHSLFTQLINHDSFSREENTKPLDRREGGKLPRYARVYVP